MGFLMPKAPSPPPIPMPPPAANPATMADSNVQATGVNAKSKAAAAASATNPTGPQGLKDQATPTAQATLLGGGTGKVTN